MIPRWPRRSAAAWLLFFVLPAFCPAAPLAAGKPKFLGGISSAAQAVSFTAYWNQVTPENAGKWGSVEATRNVMNWTELDAAYALAKDNGFPFRFHVLIWGNQQPAWLAGLPPTEQRAEIEQWFDAVATRYPDIDYLEVVNEPLHDPPDLAAAGNAGTSDSGNYLAALGGAGASGWDWVLTAFEMARQRFPEAKLMINDYSVENSTTGAQQYAALVGLLRSRGLVDVIGVQGHAFSTTVSAATLKAGLDLLAAAGLPIWITELDIDGPTDQTQLGDYQRIFPVFWEHPAVAGVTLWGYRPGLWRNAQGAYLIRPDGTERPALDWLRTYVAASDPPLRPIVSLGEVEVRGTPAVFDVGVAGNPTPSIQWQRTTNGGLTWENLQNDSMFSGVTSSRLSVANQSSLTAPTDLRVTATNPFGSAGFGFSLTTSIVGEGSVITRNPINQTATLGRPATFSAAAAGAGHWQVSTDGGTIWTDLANGGTYSGVTTATLTIGAATDAMNGYRYRYSVSAPGVTVTSAPAVLTVQPVFFPAPAGLALDASGNLFVADAATNTVAKVTPAGVVSPFAGTSGAAGSADGTGAAALFNQPGALALAPDGTLFVADAANATIRQITPGAVVTTFAGSAGARGNADQRGSLATFSNPTGLARDFIGWLYVADSTNHTIRLITSTAQVRTFAGSAGTLGSVDGTEAAARFNRPTGAAVDAAGNVYVTDTTNNTIRKITVNAVVTTLAGVPGIAGSSDGTGPAALFNQPTGIAIDGAGCLYVADTGNSTIRKIFPDGTVVTLAGLPTVAGLKNSRAAKSDAPAAGTPGELLDGTGAGAWFNQPRAVAVDAAGNVYVADTGNAAIRKVSPAGVVTTLALSAATAPTPTPTPTPNPGVPSGGGGGGGGGAISGWMMAALAMLLSLRRRRNRPSVFGK